MARVKRSRLGRHVLVDFFGVSAAKLRDRAGLMRALREALGEGGFTVVREAGSHQFQGGGRGVTGFLLLAQSHAAFHSYPEYGYMALDIYSCGSHDPDPIVRRVAAFLKPRRSARMFHRRGTMVPAAPGQKRSIKARPAV